MFLGPIEEHKPWSVNGISGVYGFFKKTWKLFTQTSTEPPTEEQLKVLHKTIKKTTEDIEKMALNTVISTFMIAVNEWSKQKCNNREILTQFLILLSPFAPHFSEELWEHLGHSTTISNQPWPSHNDKYLIEQMHEYPISFNGKMRFKIEMALDLSKQQIEEIVINNERAIKHLSGKTPKKIIVVPGKIVNIVI